MSFTIQWTLVALILVFEMTICFILVLPLPLSFRKLIWKFFATSHFFQKSKTVMIFMGVVLAALFADAYRSSVNYHELSHEHANENLLAAANQYSSFQTQYFRSQRNMYLSGFTLFLGLILYRFMIVLGDLYKIQENAEVVQKQAKNQQDEYLRITKELEKEKNPK